ncbi:MAG: hypothetical protein R6V32_05460 [Bacteroidales bacterium]
MKKTKYILLGITLLLICGELPAQWFAGIQGGYIFPRNMGKSALHYNRTIEEDYYHDTDPQITEENIYFNVWESFSYGISGGYCMNNLEFDLSVLFTSNISNQQLPHNKIETHYTRFNPLNDHTITKDEYRKFYNRSIIISPGFQYNFLFGDFRVSPFLNLTIQITQIIEKNSRFYEEEFYDDSFEAAVTRKYEYKPSHTFTEMFNPEAGIQFEYMVIPSISVCLNSSVSVLKNHTTFNNRKTVSEEMTSHADIFEEYFSFSEKTPFTANLSNIKTNIGIRYYFKNQEK